ncbi:hypothetical protein ACFVVX_27090 [Kitasatospora sp. NPDC058170]|uniref:hypothetical protein n=1 Tax=Kitasatospora sp. NPDC058170 TaxID=3346364 RepID=UPI0036DCDA65
MTMTAEAWIAPELQIWKDFAARLATLREHPQAKAVLAHAQLDALAEGPLDGIRVSDLSVAIFHLENALADDRAPLPKLALMEPDDVLRHPGFDGVEDDSVAEEERLLSLREALRGE